MSDPKPWFRFYRESLNDPKVQRLPASLFRTWVNCLCLACEHGGRLPAMAEIAFALRMSDTDAQAHIDELIGIGLIDIKPGRILEPHNWHGRQYQSDTSRERTRKWRKTNEKKTGDVTVTSHVTPPDTDTDTDTDTETPLSPPERGAPRRVRKRDKADAMAAVWAQWEAEEVDEAGA